MSFLKIGYANGSHILKKEEKKIAGVLIIGLEFQRHPPAEIRTIDGTVVVTAPLRDAVVAVFAMAAV